MLRELVNDKYAVVCLTIYVMIIAAISLTMCPYAGAAEFSEREDNTFVYVVIKGEIVDGDTGRFIDAVQAPQRSTKKLIVQLESPGGSVQIGLQIADSIHRREWSTYVPKVTECNSICAVIWLAGKERWATATSMIGFHAAYNSQAGQEAGVPNALLGSNYSKWGLNDKAIAYLTSASPNEVIYLTDKSAKKYDIAYRGELPTDGFIQQVLQKVARETKRQDPPPAANVLPACGSKVVVDILRKIGAGIGSSSMAVTHGKHPVTRL